MVSAVKCAERKDVASWVKNELKPKKGDNKWRFHTNAADRSVKDRMS